MKKLYFVLFFLLSIGLWACKDDKKEPGSEPYRLDLNATIKVSGKNATQKRSLESGVMTYDDSIKMIAKYSWLWTLESKGYADLKDGFYDFGIGMRDTINNKLIWQGRQVIRTADITENGDTIFELGPNVTNYFNYVIVAAFKEDGTPYQPDASKPDYVPIPREKADTIAYIPNSVVYKARELITEAFEKKDYKRCYELFDSAYVFIPTTGERYRALMEKGEN